MTTTTPVAILFNDLRRWVDVRTEWPGYGPVNFVVEDISVEISLASAAEPTKLKGD